MKAENYKTEVREISGFRVNVTTYKIADTFYCKIDNVDPGATIARSEAKNLDEAVNVALSKASKRLGVKM
jgi:hypothetical protein